MIDLPSLGLNFVKFSREMFWSLQTYKTQFLRVLNLAVLLVLSVLFVQCQPALAQPTWTPDITTDAGKLSLIQAFAGRHPGLITSNLKYGKNPVEVLVPIPGLLQSLGENGISLEIGSSEIKGVTYSEAEVTFEYGKIKSLKADLIRIIQELPIPSGEFKDVKSDLRFLIEYGQYVDPELGEDKPRLSEKQLKSMIMNWIQVAPLLYNGQGKAVVSDPRSSEFKTSVNELTPHALENSFGDFFENHLRDKINRAASQLTYANMNSLLNQVTKEFIAKLVKPILLPKAVAGGSTKRRHLSIEAAPPIGGMFRNATGANDCCILSVPYYYLVKKTRVFWLRKSNKFDGRLSGYAFVAEVVVRGEVLPYVITVNGSTLSTEDTRQAIRMIAEEYGTNKVVVPDFGRSENRYLVNYEATRAGMRYSGSESIRVTMPEGWDVIESHTNRNRLPGYSNFYAAHRVGQARLVELGENTRALGSFSSGEYRPYVETDIKGQHIFDRAVLAYSLQTQGNTSMDIHKVLDVTPEQVRVAGIFVKANLNNPVTLEQFRLFQQHFGFEVKHIGLLDVVTRAHTWRNLYNSFQAGEFTDSGMNQAEWLKMAAGINAYLNSGLGHENQIPREHAQKMIWEFIRAKNQLPIEVILAEAKPEFNYNKLAEKYFLSANYGEKSKEVFQFTIKVLKGAKLYSFVYITFTRLLGTSHADFMKIVMEWAAKNLEKPLQIRKVHEIVAEYMGKHSVETKILEWFFWYHRQVYSNQETKNIDARTQAALEKIYEIILKKSLYDYPVSFRKWLLDSLNGQSLRGQRFIVFLYALIDSDSGVRQPAIEELRRRLPSDTVLVEDLRLFFTNEAPEHFPENGKQRVAVKLAEALGQFSTGFEFMLPWLNRATTWHDGRGRPMDFAERAMTLFENGFVPFSDPVFIETVIKACNHSKSPKTRVWGLRQLIHLSGSESLRTTLIHNLNHEDDTVRKEALKEYKRRVTSDGELMSNARTQARADYRKGPIYNGVRIALATAESGVRFNQSTQFAIEGLRVALDSRERRYSNPHPFAERAMAILEKEWIPRTHAKFAELIMGALETTEASKTRLWAVRQARFLTTSESLIRSLVRNLNHESDDVRKAAKAELALRIPGQPKLIAIVADEFKQAEERNRQLTANEDLRQRHDQKKYGQYEYAASRYALALAEIFPEFIPALDFIVHRLLRQLYWYERNTYKASTYSERAMNILGGGWLPKSDPRYLEALLNVVTRSEAYPVRTWAVREIGSFEGSNVNDKLLEAFEDKNEDVRKAAEVELGKRIATDQDLLQKVKSKMSQPEKLPKRIYPRLALLVIENTPSYDHSRHQFVLKGLKNALGWHDTNNHRPAEYATRAMAVIDRGWISVSNKTLSTILGVFAENAKSPQTKEWAAEVLTRTDPPPVRPGESCRIRVSI